MRRKKGRTDDDSRGSEKWSRGVEIKRTRAQAARGGKTSRFVLLPISMASAHRSDRRDLPLEAGRRDATQGSSPVFASFFFDNRWPNSHVAPRQALSGALSQAACTSLHASRRKARMHRCNSRHPHRAARALASSFSAFSPFSFLLLHPCISPSCITPPSVPSLAHLHNVRPFTSTYLPPF